MVEPQKPVQATAPKPAAPSPFKQPVARRNFLRLAVTFGGLLSLTPYVPFGQFLIPPTGIPLERQRILLPDGQFASVRNVPTNSGAVFVYPWTGDPVKDAEPFRKFMLVRVPGKNDAIDLGGDAPTASSFRAYSRICVHLWCLPKYVAASTGKLPYDQHSPESKYEAAFFCPCHGSVYRITDGLAIDGPAWRQTPPGNALPILELSVDDEGFLWVEPPVYNVNNNGIIGFGRFIPGVTK